MNIQENKCIKKLWKLWYQWFMKKGDLWVGEDLTVQEIGDFKMVVADEHTSLYTTWNIQGKKYTNSTRDQWKEFLRGVLLIYLVRTEKQIMWSLHMSSLVFCPAICISITFSSILIIFNNYVENICITIFIHNIFYPSALNHNKHKKR